MRRYILSIFMLISISVMGQQLSADSDGRIFFGPYRNTLYNNYKLNIFDYKNLVWTNSSCNQFKINMTEETEDENGDSYIPPVTITVPNLVFKDAFTGRANYAQMMSVYLRVPDVDDDDDEMEMDANSDESQMLNALMHLMSSSTEDSTLSIASLEVAYPEMFTTDEEGNKYISYKKLASVLLKAYQELARQDKAVEEQMEMVEASLEESAFAGNQSVTGIENGKVTSASITSNNPNPFVNTTKVTVTIPEKCKTATIRISSSAGSIVEEIAVLERENTSITIDGGQWAPGIYFCSLITDGTLTGTIKMIKK